ncbi:MAG: BatD family protein, partial [Candidatus Cryptobacteroides sp.]|nr:BatD family protein [Candidatus Cryptobacteroides sp.]
FDSFFQDEYKTIRKRITTPSLRVKVNPLPAGQPASFGGGVGNFGISARLTSDELKTHDAASLILTVSGRGNVALLEDPKVSFPPDFEVYDTKVSENTDKSTGGTSGSKTFEYPFIPRSAGEFTIEPVEYSYYDVNAGKYVTLKTEPMKLKVVKGKASDASSTVLSPGVERRDVKSLAGDIRFISTKKPYFRKEGSFFVLSPLFWALTALLLLAALALVLALRKAAAMKADVALTKNRKATKMARKRLKQAGDYLDKNLYTAFYEELHKALLGFTSDKLSMDMSELSKENIAAALTEGGVSEETTKAFTDLLDSCEFARYSPDAGHDAMQTHYDGAVKVISDIDSSYRTHHRARNGAGAAVIALLLCLGLSMNANAQQNEGALVLNVSDSSSSSSTFVPVLTPKEEAVPDISVEDFAGAPADSLWDAGVAAYSDGRYYEAAVIWQALAESGKESPVLFYNIGNAFFKQSNYPQAIINYERALKLDPSYSDARFNLEYANGFVQDKIEPVPEFILKSIARKLCYVLGSDAWAVLFLVFLAAALAMAVMFLLSSSVGRRRTGFYCGIVFLLLSLASLGFSLWQRSDYMDSDDAIVTAPVSAVKSSPGDGSAKDLFVIHEGTKVKVLDEVGGWKNISLADGRQGWMMSRDMEVI